MAKKKKRVTKQEPAWIFDGILMDSEQYSSYIPVKFYDELKAEIQELREGPNGLNSYKSRVTMYLANINKLAFENAKMRKALEKIRLSDDAAECGLVAAAALEGKE